MKSILEQLEYYKEIISFMPGHVYWKDKNGYFLGCNLQQAIDAGFNSPDEMIGKSDADMPWGIQYDYLRKIDNDVMKSKQGITLEELFELPDGTKKTYLSKKLPLHDKNNKVTGILGISFDITAQKEVEELKHKLEGMTLVGATIAHELRTPLLTITMAAEGLKDYLPSLIDTFKRATEANLQTKTIRPSQLELLSSTCEGIIDETKASNLIINVLLTNLDQQNIDTKAFEKCSIANCVDEALRRYPFQPDERALIHWDNKNDFHFIGNALLTMHVLFNLLKNAIYYIRTAHKGDIHIRLESGEKYNKLYFRDTGTGIAGDILPKIFDLFFTKTYHGYGVGLAFCKMIMQAYGGEIECKSTEGEFSEFILSFPVINN